MQFPWCVSLHQRCLQMPGSSDSLLQIYKTAYLSRSYYKLPDPRVAFSYSQLIDRSASPTNRVRIIFVRLQINKGCSLEIIGHRLPTEDLEKLSAQHDHDNQGNVSTNIFVRSVPSEGSCVFYKYRNSGVLGGHIQQLPIVFVAARTVLQNSYRRSCYIQAQSNKQDDPIRKVCSTTRKDKQYFVAIESP